MNRARSRNILAVAMVAMAMVLASVERAGAQDKHLDELKSRVDQLEKQNEDLRQKLQENRQAQKQSPAEKASPGAEKEALENAVRSILEEREKKETQRSTRPLVLAEPSVDADQGATVRSRWVNNQLWFETEDQSFRFHLTGRAQLDGAFVNAPQRMMVPLELQGIGDYDNSIFFRSARIGAEGTLWSVLDYDTEYEFANTIRIAPKGAVPAAGPGQFVSTIGTSADRNATINIAVPTNLWVQWHDLPYLGNIRVGNQKQWISMEHLTSNRFLEFLERSFAFDAFIDNGNESYVPGISVWRSLLDQKLFVGAGYYVPSYLQYFGWNVGDGEGQFVARLAGTPYFAENGRYMLHLGLGYMHSTADDGAIRFRSRAQIRNGPGVMQNVLAMIQGNLNNYNLIVPEFMVNYGSFTVQAEYYGTWVHQPSSSPFSAVGNQTNPGNLPPGGRGGLIYHGGYVQTGYFLTGESRGYDRVFQVPTRQPVHENAFCVEGEEGRTFGRGAWEVVSRFEWLNLNSKSVNGGMLYGGTLGLNWYFNPNSKFQIDYCIAYRDATEYLNGQVAPDGTSIRSGWIQGLGTRFAFDF